MLLSEKCLREISSPFIDIRFTLKLIILTFKFFFFFQALTQKLTPWPNSDPVQRFRFGNDNYFARSTGTTDDARQGGDAFNRRGVTWDENLQMLSNPFRLLYESDGNIYTWLKYKNRIGPIMVADNPTDQDWVVNLRYFMKNNNL